MTGQGHASRNTQLGQFRVELRTVNNRGLKIVVRASDALSLLESEIEGVVRAHIRRGSIQISVSWRRDSQDTVSTINQDAIEAYATQILSAQEKFGEVAFAPLRLSDLLDLPGVLEVKNSSSLDRALILEEVTATVELAIQNLNEMREREGQSMADSLRMDLSQICEHVNAVAKLAPDAADHYRQRLESKVERILKQNEIEVPVIDLLREVQIYADRVDVSEEITRLKSHIEMFEKVLGGQDSLTEIKSASKKSNEREPTGRKLEFIIQELLRETNTVGSKASDTKVAAHVVEIKCAIERMRELVQNLE